MIDKQEGKTSRSKHVAPATEEDSVALRSQNKKKMRNLGKTQTIEGFNSAFVDQPTKTENKYNVNQIELETGDDQKQPSFKRSSTEFQNDRNKEQSTSFKIQIPSVKRSTIVDLKTPATAGIGSEANRSGAKTLLA